MEKEQTFMQKHGTKIKVIGGIALGLATGYILAANRSTIVGGIQSISLVHVGDNAVLTNLERRHNPGIIVKDVATGEIAASKTRLAEILGVTFPTIQNMIQDGRVEVLGESS